jgi:dCTP deaminase
MPFWSGESLVKQLPRHGIVSPFFASQIDCNAYTLRMGRQAYITPDHKAILARHNIMELDWRAHSNFSIPAGQFAFLLTEEVVDIPNNVMGFISLRTGIKFQGLINVSGFHVDPGYRGHLIYAVYNAGPTQIHLARGLGLFKIWFADLDGSDVVYAKKRTVPVENEQISPALVDNVAREILSMQNMSKRLDSIGTQPYIAKAIAIAVVAIAGLALAAVKLWVK